ncbi:MAG TPA: 3-phosphoglycerate dehydrogenase family protein [Coxiellaceae bacterium]|nr:3-phosphoglycerate dehydrogenase family protein [Coxiellaceae bacterium]
MYTLQIFNEISPKGLALFPPSRYQFQRQDAKNPEAILVRSADLLTHTFPSSVCAVGRAGAGTNNIPVSMLTKKGVAVFNTPGANANAVKELVLAGLLLACRNITQALHFAQTLTAEEADLNEVVEKGKKQFQGVELAGKTLGVIGLGAVGVKVANAAIHLGMHVIGFDPLLTVRQAWAISSHVKQADSLNELFASTDFITVHIPLTDTTKHFINKPALSQMKQGVVLLNFSREGIVDETALLEALNTQHVQTYVTDFPSAPLLNHPHCIYLPHLGASTVEAEENCAVMAAEQLKDFLENGNIQNSVNFPPVYLPRSSGSRLSVVNVNVPNMVAQMSSVLAQSNLNIVNMINKSRGEVAYTLFDLSESPTETVLNTIRGIEGILRVRNVD